MKVWYPTEDNGGAKEKLILTQIDIWISLIKKGKLTVKTASRKYKPTRLEALLIEDADFKKQVELNLEYESYRSYTGLIPFIERFRLEITQFITSIESLQSDDPDSYDKMLELFLAMIENVKANDSAFDQKDMGLDLTTLERKNWTISLAEIEKETLDSYEVKESDKKHTELQKQKIDDRISKYRRQGFKIIGESSLPQKPQATEQPVVYSGYPDEFGGSDF